MVAGLGVLSPESSGRLIQRRQALFFSFFLCSPDVMSYSGIAFLSHTYSVICPGYKVFH